MNGIFRCAFFSICFQIFLIPRMAENSRCMQQIKNEIMVEDPEPEIMCGATGKVIADDFTNMFDKLKSAKEYHETAMVSWASCDFEQVNAYNVAAAVKITRFGGGLVKYDNVECGQGTITTIAPFWRDWCRKLFYYATFYKMIHMHGCVSECVINGKTVEREINTKFHYAKFVPNENGGHFETTPIENMTMHNRNFHGFFLVDNLHGTRLNDIGAFCEGTEGRLYSEYRNFLDLGPNKCVETKEKQVGEEVVPANMFCHIDNAKAARYKPSWPTTFGRNVKPFLILEHDCTYGRSQMYQLIQLNDEDMKKHTDDPKTMIGSYTLLHIKLESEIDDVTTFDALGKLTQNIKFSPPWLNFTEADKKGLQAIRYNQNDSLYRYKAEIPID